MPRIPPVVLTDDPSTPLPNDPTETPVTADPLLKATKRAQLLTDADGNGQPSPGDTLIYLITILNVGNREATGVIFTDTPDANTTLVVGSVQTIPGVVVQGNTAGDTTVQVTIGNLAGGNAEANLSYRVTINNPLPASALTVKNQGVVQSNELPPIPTDDPTTASPDDPAQTSVTAEPRLSVNKVDRLLEDRDMQTAPTIPGCLSTPCGNPLGAVDLKRV